jgi:hypothetical protein
VKCEVQYAPCMELKMVHYRQWQVRDSAYMRRVLYAQWATQVAMQVA